MDSEDQRSEYAKLIGDGLAKGIAETMQRTFRGKVEEFLLQDLQPDTQRLEVEEVARVVYAYTWLYLNLCITWYKFS